MSHLHILRVVWRFFIVPILCVSCGSPGPASLRDLKNLRLSALLYFKAPPPAPPMIATFLTFNDPGVDCPELDVIAELDDVALAISPVATGRTGADCQIAFYMTQPPPPAQPRSVLRFSDATAQASLTANRLLESRTLTSSIADDSAVRIGDAISFAWSTNTDTISTVDAVAVSGATKTVASAQVFGSMVNAIVPSLSPGLWALSVAVNARAETVECLGAVACESRIVREDVVRIFVQ